ncbi:hypothetical protein [Rhizobium tropici]|nr:hypothetical protein [Rhizobium tropici]
MNMLVTRSDSGLGERVCMIDAKYDAAIVPDAMNSLPNTEVSA